MNDDDFLLPNDNLERQNQKLREINRVLIERLERESERNSANGVNFHSTIVLNNLITERTSELESALEMLNQSNARLERANRETELARANLANALEAVQEGFALFDADECLIMRNSRFAEMLPDIKTLIVPGMHFERYIQIVARSRYIKLNDETPLEWTERRSTAHRQPHVNFIVPLVDDHWIQVSEQRTPDGGTAILQTNVTEMMRLEHAEREKLLDKQSQLVRTTLDHVDQGICIFDSQDQLAGWNSRLLDLLSLPVTIARNGARVQSFLAYFDRYGVFEASESALIFTDWLRRVRQRRPFRVRLTRANGMILDVSARETPDGGFVASFSDVTSEQRAIKALHDANENLENRVKERTNELARARDEAELANASKTRFVAAASHDLLQPISAAKLYLASLRQTKDDAHRENLVTRIETAFESVESILEALLDISKLDTGAVSLNRTQVRVDQLFRTLQNQFNEIAARKNIEFHMRSSHLCLSSDATYLLRIMQNFVSNAIRYTNHGKVLVGVRRVPGALRLEVHDTGAGIAEDEIETIFGEFKRLNSAQHVPGMGLGLAIVARACELLGHELTVNSVEGRGSTFAVTVPRCHAPEVIDHPRDISMAESSSLDGLIVLVIENDEHVRQAIVDLLEGWDAAVLDAADFEQADQHIDALSMPPDVILSDYHLDHGTGVDAIKSLRRRYGKIPAALMTADRSDQIALDAKENGIAMMHKPVSPRALRSMMAYLRS